MSQQIKYTTDGKKVVIVGKLNTQETIVQEIFIVNGSEIPSGENFVVKSLHDAPAVSWKEKSLKDLEDRYERERKNWDNESRSMNIKYRELTDKLKHKIKWVSDALKGDAKTAFDLLVSYVSGEITHLVINKRGRVEIKPIEDFKEYSDGGLRLVSFYGKDDGTFSFRVHEYYDGSGHSYDTVYPCKSYQEAQNKMQSLVDKIEKYSDETILMCQKENIITDPEKVNAFITLKVGNLEKNIVSYQEQIIKWQVDIDKIKPE